MFVRSVRVVLGALGASLACGHAWTAEGLWPFDSLPTGRVTQETGVALTAAWVAHVQAASVALSDGCSASLVSGQGLVVTAHHCVSPCAQAVSRDGADYLRDGFTAAARREERACPGLRADILLSIVDVSARVKAAAKASGRSAEAEAARIEAEACRDRPDLRCKVVTLYSGGQHKLHTYRSYDDVRLVFAPEDAIAAFGGDPDNFNFPRYAFDVGFLRLYEHGQAAKTPQHLAWATRPPRDGEPTFFSGDPAATSRDLTLSQLELQRDVRLPTLVSELSDLRGRLVRFSEESEPHRRAAAEALAQVENVLKYQLGAQRSLARPALFETKGAAEADLKRRLAAAPALAGAAADPWAAMARVQEAYADNYVRYRMLEGNAGSGSDLLRDALALARAAEERAKPSADRLPEFADARLPDLHARLLSDRPIDRELDQLFLEFWLSKTRERLGVDDPAVARLLGKDSPESLAASAVAGTRMGDVAFRRALWQGGLAAVQASADPMIKLALRLDPPARAVRRAWEADVSGPADVAAQRIAAARFAIYGEAAYPGGTRTPRLSFGHVTGWTADGETVSPITTLGGLYGRATGAEPFRLPPRWTAAQARLSRGTAFNVVVDDDAAPGSSGSPLLNADAELLGVEFDGNIYATGGEYGYDPRVFRIVCVTSAAILEVLKAVYRDDALIAEIVGPSKTAGLRRSEAPRRP